MHMTFLTSNGHASQICDTTRISYLHNPQSNQHFSQCSM